MQCKQCGFVLPSGAAFCPHCSSPTPYNAGTAQAASPPPPPSPLAPTQYAPGVPAPLPPTQLASGEQTPLAPTQYAPGGSPSLPPTQLAAGPSGPASQLPPPPPSTPGWPTPMNQSGPGWTFQPVPPGSSGPGWPPQGPAPQPLFVPVQPQPKSGCSTATIIVLVVLLVVVCGGAILGGGIWYAQSRNAQATVTAISDNGSATAIAGDDNATATADTAQLTPTPYPPYTESNPPSGSTFSGTAQHVITYAQMASQLNSRYQPTELQSAFQIGQTVYLAYHWTNIGYSGYIYMVWYFNGNNLGGVKSAYISTNYSYYDGYSSDSFNEAGQGAIEVYWCGQADCSDRQLAWVRPFSVTS